MSLRDTRAANALPDNASLGAYREGAALLQARRENGGHMRFPDHASYLRYQRGRAQVQLRQQFRAAQHAAAPAPTVPAAPTAVSAIAGDAQATVSFTAPNDGGSPITFYTVTSNPGGIDVSGTSSPITITGLTNGTAYTFTVVATNAIGDSAPSSATTPVTPATVPDTPTGVTATAGNGQATVTFSSSGDGGTAIIYYTVTSNPGGIDVSGTSSPITVTGLTNGTSYTFTVIATNGIGDSLPSSASIAVTPDSVVRQVFTTVGTTTWTVPIGVSSIEYLVVGGGGGGGGTWDVAGGGGGGGGMVKTSTLAVTSGSTVTITVGDGGDGGVASSNGIPFPNPGNSRTAIDGSDGEASILSYSSTTISALGGGRGYFGGNNPSGGTAGSGGFGSTDSTPSTGGDGGPRPGGGGGGGGYTVNGTNSTGSATLSLTNGGTGGSGFFYSGTFGAGGKGGFGSNTTGPNNNNPGISHRPGDAGASNTGNGGGGGSAGVASWASGGKGGSGIVVIKYNL